MPELLYMSDLFIRALLLKCLHKDFPEIRELFLIVKIKTELLEKYKKTLDTKQARILKHICKYFYKNLALYTIKRVTCVLGYLIFKIVLKYVGKSVCPFRGTLK